MLRGCYTALVTPMKPDGSLDEDGLRQLMRFQSENGIAGVVAVGTTGESPTLDWNEHMQMIRRTKDYADEDILVIAGTGANSTDESVKGTEEGVNMGVGTFLLVDPYYNGPSSLEIRKEYYEPIVSRFPDASFIPYIIPGRTGTMLLPQDLAILSKEHENVVAVKEATGDLDNMRLERRLCGPAFDIVSGDDDKTLMMMSDPTIGASGVISVISNVLPGAISEMVGAQLSNDTNRAGQLEEVLKPLIGNVGLKTEEQTPFGNVICKARNPLPIKTLMNVLGMPAGPCRQPLGRMTRQGIAKLVESARNVYDARPDLFDPVERSFDISVSDRLSDDGSWEGLYYDGY